MESSGNSEGLHLECIIPVAIAVTGNHLAQQMTALHLGDSTRLGQQQQHKTGVVTAAQGWGSGLPREQCTTVSRIACTDSLHLSLCRRREAAVKFLFSWSVIACVMYGLSKQLRECFGIATWATELHCMLVAAGKSAAMPKSQILTSSQSLFVMMTFSGFKSRCATPCHTDPPWS